MSFSPVRSLLRAMIASAAILASLSAAAPAMAAPPSYTLFESGQVRPLALSPNGKTLFAVNTPDNRVEIYDVKHSGLVHRDSVPVGMEPVALAARSDDELWVVNHLSDSVSVVDVSKKNKAHVARTLLVGDEPRDIVFGGPQRDRAFITTAHRGQNSPVDPQLHTPGVGRADVWVFDANQLGSSLGGDPITIVTLFSDSPRALAVSPDGATVYAAAFLSGNRTTSVGATTVNAEGALGRPPPAIDHNGNEAPPTALIVKFDGEHWVDELGRPWDDSIRFNLPDEDVFVIDATASPPAQVPGPSGVLTGVGTVIFNMTVNPVNGKVYVSNTEAHNEARFEGPGTFAGHTVRGHLHDSRITVLDGSAVSPRHLNKHIDFNACCEMSPNVDSEKSLAQPLGMAVTHDGQTLYVAAFGSSKVGVFSTAEIEADSFIPDTSAHVELSGGGPSGLVLDEAHGWLYVLTRFDNSISIVDTATKTEIDHLAMHNPEPPSVTVGRRFLYDARTTSSHGDSSCASCHIFGDFDGLGWDLGNPDGDLLPAPGPFNVFPAHEEGHSFHPMKGPMSTQSLRGMDNHGPMHWRGDRTGANDAPSAQPDSGNFDEQAGFKKFNVAFQGLLGRSDQLTTAEMQALTDFILQVTYPPNPNRNLDSSLTADQAAGRDHFMNAQGFFGIATCNTCHVLDPSANSQYGVARPGFFGTDGQLLTQASDGQVIKIPHLRNLYQKVGMFGTAGDFNFDPQDTGFLGDQIRGFGYIHDATVDNLDRFTRSGTFAQSDFNPEGFPVGPDGEAARRQVVEFLLAFDSNMAPVVGQQITLTSGNGAISGPRIDLLEARAAAGECDLVAHVPHGTDVKGYLYHEGSYLVARINQPAISSAALRALAHKKGHEVTYTCAPPGSGKRMALDRDEDGYLDGDEAAAGSDPANPSSTP